MSSCAHGPEAPSAWVCRWAALIRPGGRVPVVGVDRDEAALAALRGISGVEIHFPDIEAGPWPFAPGEFDGVVVTNYLHRPLFPELVGALRSGGVLICETFALGNERYGRPSNPAFLLRPAELLHSVQPLAVVAFEQGLVSVPKQAVIQRVCAVREGRGPVTLEAPAASAGDKAIALE